MPKSASVKMLNGRGADCQLAEIMLGLTIASPVAQLDRAAASEAVGQKFESSRAHHFSHSSRVRSVHQHGNLSLNQFHHRRVAKSLFGTVRLLGLRG